MLIHPRFYFLFSSHAHRRMRRHNFNAKDDSNLTPLLLAAQMDSTQYIEMLSKHPLGTLSSLSFFPFIRSAHSSPKSTSTAVTREGTHHSITRPSTTMSARPMRCCPAGPSSTSRHLMAPPSSTPPPSRPRMTSSSFFLGGIERVEREGRCEETV